MHIHCAICAVKSAKTLDYDSLSRNPMSNGLAMALHTRQILRRNKQEGSISVSDNNSKEIHHFVSGQAWKGEGQRFGDILDPSKGIVQGRVQFAETADMTHAVDVAQKAFESWSCKSPMARARVMYKFRDLVMNEMDDLAKMLSSEHGKTFADAKGDIQRGIDVVEFACGIPHLLKGENSELGRSGIDIRSYRMPLGVVAGITPFNFPAMIPMWMFSVAIACGNTFILKPSEKDPSLPVRLGELFMKAGAPAGVLNVVNGDKVAVDAILHEPRIKAVSFVGSTPIAEYVYKTGTANGKRVQAMGGAKNHAVVLPDANMDFVIDAMIGAAFGSAGERCMALPVIVPVGDDTADLLIERLIPRIKDLDIAPPMDDKDLGPLVSKPHYEKVMGYIDLGVEEGADLIVDGRGFTMNKPGFEQGYYMGGSLFDNVTADMRIYKEEIFGPVLCMVRAQSYEEAIALPTKHEFGNGVALFTQNGRIAQHFATTVEVGMVGINVPIPVPLSFHTFGGWKRSAFGDHNQHGPEGVRFYTKVKTVTSRWPDSGSEGSEFSIPTHN